jgi:CheY-like chemotaxis protein/GAF domain-containing protein
MASVVRERRSKANDLSVSGVGPTTGGRFGVEYLSEDATDVAGVMSQPKPKLLIVGPASISAEDLRKRLGDQFDVVVQGVAPAGSTSEAAVATEPPHPAELLLNAISDAVCLIDATASQVWASARFAGLSESLLERVRGCYAEAIATLIDPEGTLSRAGGATCKFEITSEDDESSHEVFIFVADPGGVPAAAETSARPPQLAVVVRDVSTDRQFGDRLAAIERAGAELVDIDAEVIRAQHSAERLKTLEGRIASIARDLLRFDHFVVRLKDELTGRLEPVMAVGLPQEALDLELFAQEEGNGLSGFVAATGRSVICPDVEADDRFMPGVDDAGSSLTVPLRLREKTIGVLNIESRQIDAFTDTDRRFCEVFARYISIALHMLDLLVVERSSTNLSVSGRVEGELKDCLEDILSQADWLTGVPTNDPETARHIARIRADVESIRSRVRNMADGPQTLLGVDRALGDRAVDPVLGGKRVLVADDESKIRRIIRDVLRSRGCEVEICENGAVAIERLNASDQPTFDLVISDIKMPDRNGYEVFSAARALGTDLPVILMTGFGYDPHHSIVRASQEGLQSVLFKPFQIERLIDEARKALAAD